MQESRIIGDYWNGISAWTISIYEGLSLEYVWSVIHGDPMFATNAAVRSQ